MSAHSRRRRAVALAALAALGGCTDRSLLTQPERMVPGPGTLAATCRVTVATRAVTCDDERAGTSRDRIIGGQDLYVKLAASGASYDGGTEIFQMDVTVQNLGASAIGTTDGSTVDGGVNVFFSTTPTVTGGSGSISIFNATGSAMFTASNQPYFLYNQVLQPLEVSTAATWKFAMTSGVTAFTFQVFVDAKMADESSTLLSHTWTGATSSDWNTASNWAEGVVPSDTMSVRIPALASLTSGVTPALAADTAVRALRVGTGSTLNLSGHVLTVFSNMDATGSVTNGTVRMTGTGVLLSGTVNALQVNGNAKLQGATTATGAVAVFGTLTVTDQTLTIAIP